MKKLTTIAMSAGGAALLAATLVGCGGGSSSSSTNASAATTSSSAATAASADSAAGVVLPVTSNPIVNTATDPTLEITYAAVEDNVDPSGKAIDDRLELTLKNTGSTPMTGIEVYYGMTDVVTGQTEAYYQKLDGVTIDPGQETTVYFDNQTGVGHFPENDFSLYRSSTNEVDFAIQVSAPGAKVATATAVKATGTGEKAD